MKYSIMPYLSVYFLPLMHTNCLGGRVSLNDELVEHSVERLRSEDV